ncbi:serine/threonine-protein kinase [Streptomyces sp. t39]|uniref:serine/threonine-protein kinase n=1 Tax=Streptomyces sp. t39 TaxID=1828156 RepID=UPI0011CDF29F|nr:serine/threonine-protein kinase [Streptomyces sp. t39]TXS56347.1 serine/threonine protein kinase [Streptomyces sp. t39]
MQPLDPGEPRSIGGYRLLGRLGAGGMGRVYLGRSAGGRTVAVKAVHPHFALDDEFRARFRREVEAARRVGGEWTAPVLDAGPDDPVPWVATGYVAGPALSQAVAAHGPLPADAVRVLGAGLARALEAVHGLGLVHRDVKPSNVLLTLEGPRLIDFGIARATDGTASLTSTGVSVGSPGYMAPEQILGKGVTGAADVFSLGAVLVYAATGQAPFAGDSSAALLYKVVHEEPELGSLDASMREIAGACLAKDPAARPAPAELAARLDEAGADIGPGSWLPEPVVRTISHAAVELLHLESFPAGGDAADAPGPPAVPAPAGAFGPPVEPAGPAAPWAPAPGPGGLSLTASGGPRGRRVSCTLALTLAGALAAVTLGGAFVLDLLPGAGGGERGADAGKRPSGSATASEAPGSGDAEPGGRLPKEFAGTWEGAITASGLPAGTMKVTLKEAGTGERTGEAEQTDILGNVICVDVLTLAEAKDRTVLVDSEAGPRSTGVCTTGTSRIRLELRGDGLRYVSSDDRAGRPTGTLARVGGR